MKKLFSFFFIIGTLAAQNREVDSLKALLSKAFNDTLKCYYLSAMVETEANDSAWPIYNMQLKQLAEKNLGKITNVKQPEYKVFKKYLAFSYINEGYLLKHKGNIKEALIQYEKSIRILEEINDTYGLAVALNNLGLLYCNQENSEKGLELLNKSYELAYKINNHSVMAMALNNISLNYVKTGHPNEALVYYKKSLTNYLQDKNLGGAAIVYNNIGDIYHDKGELDLALEYYKKALEAGEKINYLKSLIGTYISLAKVYQERGQNKLAIEYAEKGLDMGKKLNYPERIQLAANALSGIYRKNGNYKKALENYELHILMRDSINNIENRKASIRSQLKYEFEKKQELQRVEQEKKDEIALQEKRSQRIFTYSVVVVALLLLFLAVMIFRNLNISKKKNLIISDQKKEVERQKHQIEEKHKEITDSINYAERIQRSLLASKELLDENLKDYFIYFQPKDVVSGDFYWAGKLQNGRFALVTADSTGHGVPGAIMSFLNISCLEKAVEVEKQETPNLILQHARTRIIETLKKDGSKEGGKDGMDCSICVFDLKTKKLFVSAANNPVWILREGAVSEVSPDRFPVGKHDKDKEPFTLHTVDLQLGDIVYTLTDGYADQFGGSKGKKFKYKQLQDLLCAIGNKSMNEQREELKRVFEHWKGDLEQIDDVCIIGVRIT